MSRVSLVVHMTTAVLTVAALTTWLATGAHPYTKFQEVLYVETEASPEDPFTEAGFYSGGTVEQMVKKGVFFFGLLPTPQGLVDKHVFSVVSIIVPTWMISGFLALVERRQRRKQAQQVLLRMLTL